MLGQKICDPYHTESSHNTITAFSFLPMITTFARKKITSQVTAQSLDWHFLDEQHDFSSLHGYEIHMGLTEFTAKTAHPFVIKKHNGKKVDKIDGAISSDNLIMGSYIHGIFDNDEYRRTLLNMLRRRKGLSPLPLQQNYAAQKQAAFNRLAQTVRNALDMEKLKQIINKD
jgi:adenosylcobyric acid synthase